MTDLTGKNWMAMGETDDPNAIIESFEAQAAVTKGDPVYLSADNKVSPATAPQNCIGVAVKNAAPSEQCPVLIRGRVKVKAGDAITRGKAVYGAADKSVPLDKDSWTESLSPADGAWSTTSGTVSFDTSVKAKGAGSVKTYAQNLNYASCLFTLNAGKGVDTAQYPALNVWLSREAAFNGNVTLTLFDAADRAAGHEFTVGHEKWFQTQVQFGADAWQADSGFDWSHIKKVRVTCWFDGAALGLSGWTAYSSAGAATAWLRRTRAAKQATGCGSLLRWTRNSGATWSALAGLRRCWRTRKTPPRA
jgi:hypothetical protein